MKKLLVLSLMMLSTMASTAQGVWSTGMREADELIGDTGGPHYQYEIENDGGFILWDWDDWHFKILTRKGGFDVWYNTRTGERYTNIKLGVYKLDGKMIDKCDSVLSADHTHKYAWITYGVFYPPVKKKIIKKMFKLLKSGEGYARILSARMGAPEFDLKITPYNL